MHVQCTMRRAAECVNLTITVAVVLVVVVASGNDTPLTLPKTAEHEVKVHFAREFADVGSVTENLCLAPESLSSASSFHSLSSTLSIKSSSGTCTDSISQTPDNVADTSYVNSNIPGVEDLILACADIHLGSEHDSQDLSQDQTFTSAIDEVPFPTRNCSLNEDLLDNADNETQVIETNPQLCKTTPLNQTHILGSSNNTLPVQDSQFVTSYPPAEEYVLQVEESIDKHIPLQESATVSEIETCNIVSNLIKDSLPTSNVNDNQLNITTTVSSNNTTFDVIALNEEQTVKDCNAETLSQEDPQSCPTEISVPSISPLAQYADLSLPSISNISLPLEHTDNSKTQETSIQTLSDLTQDTLTVLSSSDNLDQKLCVSSQVIVNNSITQTKANEIIKEQELPELDNSIVPDKEDNILLLNNTSIIEPKTSEIEENLQTSVDKKDLEVEHSVVLNEVQKLSEEEIAICNETNVIEKQNNSSETIIIEKEKCIVESAPTTSDSKKDTSIEILDRTLTLQEIDINFAPDEEQYEEFKPQRQSTTLSLINGHFEELKSTVEKVTNELLNPSLEFTEETDQFVSATPEFFQDPSTFDFLLARSNPTHTNRLRTESLYVKFDPLVSNISMLPQGNAQTINEEKNGKNESPLPDVGTPKRNPAIAAIDRLLFYSPLPNATVQKSEEVQEKNEQPVEEPKLDTPLIDHIDMSKELELVRTTVLQLEEELEKQKKEHEAELERQKAAFQEKINKLQAQMSQEIKTKTQMTVVVEEYEKSISRLLTERERDRTSFEQDKIKLQEELQAANHHLTNTEAAFNDVHQKYERLKGVVSVYKNNETVLKESIQENVETIKTLETRYDQLKEHAMAQLEKANLELDGIRKQNEAETVKLHAMIRKAELKSNSLAELVEQKSKENKELAKILDEVIARVGHGNSE
ncbi:PREDICTED: transforming acidic coiled-coil-containing protein 3 isoform X2 [Trachymyrmex septentrionalis]|uniref:transforming acidic coiled-coil-containing protein 3 isoform X2 n=1 Tax=Trachymyrmex septentrionalis TaxID=34720 RepID=UPI00084EDA3D|nr:PREDICTED: transforming acidic coiled-coil-containing protein 3 isoform X2 [Trachymyrmex septentrionalis]